MSTNVNETKFKEDTIYGLTNLTTVPLLASTNQPSNLTVNENVIKISETNQLESSQELMSNQSIETLNSIKENESIYMCRICHCEEKAISDQLITPCHCNGSLNFVHQVCLQKWLQITGSKSCELCNYNFELVKKYKSIMNWENVKIPRSEKTKIILSIILYVIAIVINSWSFSTFWNITMFYVNKNRFNWTFLTIILVLSSSFICMLSFVVFLLQIFYNLFTRFREHNRYVLVKSLKKDIV